MTLDPQIVASDPEVSAFVTANAGSGKTRTLVDRVARLLLRGARPEAILCVTYTKAAAAEMQSRLFKTLGDWAVMSDDRLTRELETIDERPASLAVARALFARALETPGGLKIETIHAFCEKLLKRFPLEAGVSPGFRVLEDQAAREVSAEARDEVAHAALDDPDGAIGRAYVRFAVDLDFRAFQDMFAGFEARRRRIKAYVEACAEGDGVPADVWRLCGFAEPGSSADLEAEALAGVDWPGLRRAAEALLLGSEKSDIPLGLKLAALAEAAGGGAVSFAGLWSLFCTKLGTPLASLGTKAVAEEAREWLKAEQVRLGDACARIKAARVAEDTVSALILATAYAELYEGAKGAQGGLDFGDFIARTRELLTTRAGAAWVLYKLDGGVDHVLVDEAQDTASDQWEIVDRLTDEFFAGAGTRSELRTVFAVGDEKQSIFSFQGADPALFLRQGGRYRRLIGDAGRRFVEPQLLQSWRSTPEVLDFVDAVFSDPAALAALRPEGLGGGPVVHQPTRGAGAGSVDLWPLEESEAAGEADPWDPVDMEALESAGKTLARRIALEIKAMVKRREAVFGKALGGPRAMGYGDVLILVRRRASLFNEIIRALKREDVPVGGADRLMLSDHIVFDDLLGLARFCLYPRDDFTLAALLRSPFCAVDEDSLYALAQPRTGSLWAALKARADERPEWRAAREFFDRARAEARSRPPFDFYARLLARTDADGRSMRARILTRLGREAEQALDAFLAEALAAEARGVRDLESFAAEMAESEIEVKRQQDDGKGEVRVMTVHGAKGLEAPVVILPDTATRATAQGGPLLDAAGAGFLWSARKGDDCAAAAAARDARSEAADRESLRLLYVALTRARDRLIVCGVKPYRDGDYRQSWHDLISRAKDHEAIAPHLRELEDGAERVVLRYGADPVRAETVLGLAGPAPATPDWLGRPAPAEPPGLRYASPSQVVEFTSGPSPSPLAEVGGLGRFRRGDLIHKLLQILPDLEPERREAAARTWLDRERDLTPAQCKEMAGAALTVLDDPRFAAVFGPGSRAEAAIAGRADDLPEGLAVSGRVDRLLIEPDRVLVVDYKTNRPSPDRVEDADPAYITQMALYAAVLRAIFPGRRVEAALVWTDGPKLMTVPENMMAKALQALPPSRC